MLLLAFWSRHALTSGTAGFPQPLTHQRKILACGRSNVVRHLGASVGPSARITNRLSTGHNRHAVNSVLSCFVYARSHFATSAHRIHRPFPFGVGSLLQRLSNPHSLSCTLCTLFSTRENVISIAFIAFRTLCAKHPGYTQERNSVFSPTHVGPSNSFRIRTYNQTPPFGRNQPQPAFSKSFTICTYRRPLRNSFRIRTYEKTRGWGFMLTGHPAISTGTRLTTLTCPNSAARLATSAPIP